MGKNDLEINYQFPKDITKKAPVIYSINHFVHIGHELKKLTR